MSTTKRLFLSVIFSVFAIFLFAHAPHAEASKGDNVYGMAYSDNIGWISFNNCDQSGKDTSQPGKLCDDPDPNVIKYGVAVDKDTGVMSGQAWSDEVGWISFNERSGCPITNCTAAQTTPTLINGSAGTTFSGFARVLTYNVSNGGWDGWIDLGSTNNNDGWTYDASTKNVSGQAWGDLVLGWVVPASNMQVIFNGFSITSSVSKSCKSSSINPNGGQSVKSGDAVTVFNITVATGCEIDTVTLDDATSAGTTTATPQISNATSYSFDNTTVDRNRTIDVAFKPYSITSSVGTSCGTSTISPLGEQDVFSGDPDTTFTITTSGTCAIQSVVLTDQINGSHTATPQSTTASSYTFKNKTVNADRSIVVNFFSGYTITSSAGLGGTINPNGITTVKSGDPATVYTISPDATHDIDTVTLTDQINGSHTATPQSSSASSYSFNNGTVNANRSISVTFKSRSTYNITACAVDPATGTLTPSGVTAVPVNGSQTYYMTPATNYEFDTLTVDGVSRTVRPQFGFSNVTADHAICATFKPIPPGPFTIHVCTAPDLANGTIAPSVDKTVNSGNNSATYTVKANSGYYISEILVDGSSVATPPSGSTTYNYAIPKVAADHQLCATFSANTLPECNNGVDDDLDGYIDYGQDPGCSSTTDTSEKTTSVIYTEH